MAARSRHAAALALTTLAACASPPPPPPPPLPVPPAAPPATAAVTAAPPAAPPFEPQPPFAIVARAPAHELLGVLPIEGGALLVAKRSLASGAPTVAVLDHDVITAVPGLGAGFPEELAGADDLPLAAGRWPDEIWRAHGTPCQVEQWDNGAWVSRAPQTPIPGACTKLAAWTAGAAVAAVEGPNGTVLRAFGRVGGKAPLDPPPPRAKAKACASLFGVVHALFAWPTGEILAVGSLCAAPDVWMARWPSGAARATTLDAQIDGNAPYWVRTPSKEEIVIDGGGMLPEDKGEETSVRARFRASAKALRRTALEAHEVNALEQWMASAKTMLGLPEQDPSDGFVYEEFRLTSSDDVFVTGRLVRGGQPVERLVLRSRPVRKPFVFP